METLLQAFRSNTSIPAGGLEALYYGHCRWCLVFLASGLWWLLSGNVDLIPVVAFFVYLFSHFPAKWFSQYRMLIRARKEARR